MIEALLFASLGFFAAAIIALALMNMLWQRAVRLTQERIEASAPTTLREMTAIRDALRAEHAVALCRMEQGLNRLRGELTSKTIGYRNAQEALRLAQLEAAATEERIRELGDEIAARQSRINVLEDNLTRTTQALKDASRAMRETEGELRTLEKALNDSESLADSRKVEVAALKTRVSNLQNEIEDLRKALASDKQALVETESDRTKKAARVEADSDEMERTYAKLADVQSRLALAAAQSARREQQLLELEERLKAYEAGGKPASGIAIDDETSVYLKEKLAQYAAELAHFAASVEGRDGKINALIAAEEAESNASVNAPLTLADRIRLIAGKTARH